MSESGSVPPPTWVPPPPPPRGQPGQPGWDAGAAAGSMGYPGGQGNSPTGGPGTAVGHDGQARPTAPSGPVAGPDSAGGTGDRAGWVLLGLAIAVTLIGAGGSFLALFGMELGPNEGSCSANGWGVGSCTHSQGHDTQYGIAFTVGGLILFAGALLCRSVARRAAGLLLAAIGATCVAAMSGELILDWTSRSSYVGLHERKFAGFWVLEIAGVLALVALIVAARYLLAERRSACLGTFGGR